MSINFMNITSYKSRTNFVPLPYLIKGLFELITTLKMILKISLDLFDQSALGRLIN